MSDNLERATKIFKTELVDFELSWPDEKQNKMVAVQFRATTEHAERLGVFLETRIGTGYELAGSSPEFLGWTVEEIAENLTE